MISAAKPTTCTLVVSKGQSRNPAKRGLESAIAQAAGQLDGVEVIMVPHLYDLPKGGESLELLQKIEGDLIVCSWIFSRAAHWVLDRNGIGGVTGEVELGADEYDEEESPSATAESATDEQEPVDRVTDLYPRPDRTIHCLDLKVSESADDFIGEIKRILNIAVEADRSLPIVGGKIVEVDETTSRRWYPVIDFSRCTNCMECIDFCLFGVYGVDGVENILVEQPDNCRKGCPACSRVCPENAIIFPQHKAPAIAGAVTEGDEGFKIDLSQLFGAPTDKGDPIATAARERDEQLLLTGREAVGIDDNLKKRQAALNEKPKDNLDRLIDSLDELDL
ncbi:4Fe-4S dicluster domain-containing protein [Rhodopirellula europaea]|uniref:Ferredoxin MJ0251-putative Fe-S containing oxidoreductase n=1 Tax=Rhodopirellula europaea 6C TaxID=1263867 RepID=M2A339_9BACT|nr:ferredoxin family protein [Rhodopirellula europaea]EMB13081.1 ferredoxin MJ0251-putative Fe-S containing oxidoreductase [Rhodopirellula europaea 6C]